MFPFTFQINPNIKVYMAKRKHPDRDRPPRQRAAAAAWLYGTHAVTAALANPARTPRRLLVTGTPPPLPGHVAVEPEFVPRETVERVLAAGAVHQGIALLADVPAETGLADLCRDLPAAGRVTLVVLDQVSDPHNVGAVLRSAAVFGAAAVLVQERHAPGATGALAKAASGALETVPLIRVGNLVKGLGSLKKAGFWCAGLDAQAPDALADADLAERTVLVLGAEGRGLRRLVRENCDLLVRIPAAGSIASLNVSNAAAIALYEISRRG
jgi:23S rRNA (guanosine2251-2'-O)-methyltransferase